MKTSHIRSILKLEPLDHQVEAIKLGMEFDGAALLMEQGTGKTAAAIGITGLRFNKGQVKKLLIVAPLSVLSSWEEQLELFANFPYKLTTLSSKTLKTQLKGLKKVKELQIALVNYDAIYRNIDSLLRWKPDLVICDESQKIKNGKAKRSKAIHRLGNRSSYRMILTGTPVTQSPMDLWSQYKFLDSDVFGNSFVRFRTKYAVMGGYFKKQVVRYKNLKTLARKAHSIAYRVTKEEALDLPPFNDQTLEVYLSEQALAYYKDMEEELVVSIGEDEVIAPIILTKLLRLQQITGGFLKIDNEDGTHKVVPVDTEKLALVKEFLEDLPRETKVVFFARFLPEIKAIEAVVKSVGRKAVVLTGKTDKAIRGKLIKEFQTDPNTTDFIAQIRTGGVGITLTAASIAFFYSNTFSYADYEQARARIHRLGQNKNVTFINLVAKGTIDEDILMALKDKRDIAELVVDKYKKERNMDVKQEELKAKLALLKMEVENTEEVEEEEIEVKKDRKRSKDTGEEKPKKECKARVEKEGSLPSDADVITVKELANELKTTPKDLRKRLRKLGDADKAGGRWEWVRGSEAHKKIVKILSK